MGQGHYVGFAFGAVLTEKQIETLQDDLGDWDGFVGEEPERAYESRERWVGYPVTCDSNAAWGATERLEYTAFPLEQLTDRYAEAAKRAQRKWVAFATWALSKGVDLTGCLLLVADYD